MSMSLPLGLGRLLSAAKPSQPLRSSFFLPSFTGPTASSSRLFPSPSRLSSASPPLSISGLCFFSPSSFSSARSSPLPLKPIQQATRTIFSRPIAQTRSPLDGIAKRAFSTSRSQWIRQTYFPRGGGNGGSGGGGRRGGNSWFREFRVRIDAIPPMAIIYGLIAINVGVYLLWQYAIQSWQRFRDPSLYHWLTRNFVLSEANMMKGRIWTLLTCCFSHSGGTHIFMNCLGLYFIAPAVAGLIGSSAFLGLYMAGGIFASLVSLGWRRVRGDKVSGSEGASGAIYSCLAFYGALFPNTQFLLFFVLPLPAWAMIGGIFAWDLYGALFTPGSGTDSAGHMGGILAGLAGALMVRRRGLRGFRRW